MTDRLTGALQELAETARRTADTIGPDLEKALAMVRAAVQRGGTLYFCGNGGSAADAQHLATEYVVRYMKDRRAYPAVALTTDSSLLTATGNDLGFEHVFARQVEALCKPGDLLIIHSTSTGTFFARDGGALKKLADHSVVIPTTRTDRAQELHLCIEHAICEVIEGSL